MLQINPALAKIWLSPSNVQFGYPEGVRIDGLTPETERMLHFLEQGYLESQLPVLARLAGCDLKELETLLEALRPLIADWTIGLNRFEKSRLDYLQPEIHRLMRAGKMPAAVLEGRSQMPVFISDLGRFGSLLMELLVDLGFDYFITSDASLRSSTKPQGSGAASWLRILKDSLPKHCILQLHSLLHESTARRVGLAILVEFEVCNPLDVQFWQSFDVPTLRVRFSESGCQVLGTWQTVQFQQGAGSRESAIAQAQLARFPRRLESIPEVIEAAHLTVREVLNLAELNSAPLGNLPQDDLVR